MRFKSYWRALDANEKRAFAEKCGVQTIYLFQIVCGHGRPSPELAWKIQVFSAGKVTAASLRPDVYALTNTTDAASPAPAAA
jgi:DNA-binding transcriptional regulator YdaS (Cro superfamily)